MPIKTGLNYFAFDIDFFNDEKIEFVSAKYGVEGELIAVRLLCRIYRNGYYQKWDDDQCLLFAKRSNIDFETVQNTIQELIKREFFNEKLYKKYGILTSKGVQMRYFESVKRRSKVDVEGRFLLINDSNGYILPPNVNILTPNDDISPIKKVKESKESKESSSFELFWNLYDKKINKIKCSNKWNRLTVDDKKNIMELLPDYIKSTPDKTFRKHPMTYLNNRSWEDEIVTKADKPHYRKTKTGMYVAYCSKCGNKEFPGNDYQLRGFSGCCSADYLPEDPNNNPEWVKRRIKHEI